jgi:hypothetical protein
MKDVGKLFGHLVYFTAMSNILFSGGTLVSTWSILQPFGLFCSHLVYFTAIWSILQPFGLFYSHFVYFVAILVFCGTTSENFCLTFKRCLIM